MYILLAEANDRRQRSARVISLSGPMDPSAAQTQSNPKPAELMLVGTDSSGIRMGQHGVDSGGIRMGQHHMSASASASVAEEAVPLLRNPSSSGSTLVGPPLTGLSSAAEVLYYSAVSSIPLLMLGVVITAEVVAWPVVVPELYARLGSGVFWPWLASLAWMETALAGSLVWCVTMQL